MKREKISEEEVMERYDDMLDECYEGVFGISPSRILEECDPIQYSCGLADYYDNMSDEYICEDME